MSKRYKARRTARRKERQPFCQNCRAPYAIRCRLIDDKTLDYHVETLCGECAVNNGYCRGCGEFWAGVSSFDFSTTGICENCRANE